MSTDSLDPSSGTQCARRALADARASSGELQASLSGAFDRLNEMADEMLAHELSQQHSEWQALDGRIERLTSLAAELAESVASQKQLAGQRFGNGRGR
jgi:hypothetical protein